MIHLNLLREEPKINPHYNCGCSPCATAMSLMESELRMEHGVKEPTLADAADEIAAAQRI